MNVLRGSGVRLAAVGAAAAVGLALFAAAPANAAQGGYCTLKWKRAQTPEYVELSLDCPADSSSDKLWKIEIWADDAWSDDRIHTYYINCDPPKPVKMTIHENWLNEDIGDRDEVYTKAFFRKSNDTSYSKQSGTNITGWWGTRTVVGRPSSTLC